jgi:hypothetical protein
MLFEFLKAENHNLEIGIQTPHPVFFRNQYLEAIARNKFFYIKNSIDPNMMQHTNTHDRKYRSCLCKWSSPSSLNHSYTLNHLHIDSNIIPPFLNCYCS